jgi:hypothetical protein
MMLLLCLAIISLYTFLPFPEWLCRWTLLSYVTGTRALLAIGIAGILLTTMIFAKPFERPRASHRAVLAVAAIAGFILLLVVSYPGNKEFLTFHRCLGLLALNGLFVGAYCFAPLRIFCGIFLLCLVVNNGSVNPISIGLGPLLDAKPGMAVREIWKRDPAAKWMAYSSAQTAQFLKSQGADVVNGLNFVPDLKFCRALDPTGQFDSICNRYALSTFVMARGTKEFRTQSPSIYAVDIYPIDPLLAARDVRYAVFPEAVQSPGEKGLRLIAHPLNNPLWIYETARTPPR